MNIEEKVKMNLLIRGFDNKTQLNNRGLIGATIDETILEVVKKFAYSDVSKQREQFIAFAKFAKSYQSSRKVEKAWEQWIQKQ